MTAYAQNPRVWIAGGALAALLVVVLSWLLAIGPELSDTGALRDQAVATRQQNDQLRLKVAALQAKSKKSPQYAASLERDLAALPPDSGLPTFTRQLDDAADAAHVSLKSVVVSGVAPVDASGGTSVVAAPSAGGTTSAAPGSLFAVHLTVSTKGSLADQLAFLRALQGGARRVLVTGTQIAPNSVAKHPSVDAVCTLNIAATAFSAPQSPEQARQLRQLLADLRG